MSPPLKLLAPLDINGMVLPNRVVVPAMVTRLSGEDGVINDHIIDRYVRYAAGQVGLIVVEATAVHGAKSGPLLRLSDDSFIPGHFGHVAIWIGSERDLRELGLWEHPAVIPHHALIREEGTPGDSHRPHLIVEALRSGVQLSTLPDFLNVDDVAILRPVALADDREAIRESILLALRQVGKEYDFNFDVNTTEKIVCSELVYVAIPAIAWPTENTLGRSTISPDHVAQLAWQEDPLQLVVLYHDGKRIPEERQLGLMRSLMQTR